MASPNTGDCTPDICPVEDGYLSYQPSLDGSAFMLAAFAVLVPINFFTCLRYKTPLFASAMILGLLLEIMGYVGRLLMRIDQARQAYFLLALLGTMIGPTFITASIYLVLPHILIVYGQEISIVSQPIYLSVVFLAFDVFTLAFLAVGCSFAVSGGSQGEMSRGIRILLTGLGLQAASLVVFFAIYWSFSARRSSRRHLYDRKRASIYLSSRFRTFLWCIQLAGIFILIRTVSCLVQYSGSLGGSLAQSQIMFLVLDGTQVLLACIILTALPPGSAFGSTWSDTSPYNPTGEDLPLRQRSDSHPATLRTQEIVIQHYVDHPSPEAAYTPSPRRSAGRSPGNTPGTPYSQGRAPYEIQGTRVPYIPPSSSPQFSTHISSTSQPRRAVPAARKTMVEPDSLW